MYGATSIKDVTAGSPGFRSTLSAPQVLSYIPGDDGAFQVEVRLPEEIEVIGAMLAFKRKRNAQDFPFKGLTMSECLALAQTLSIPMGGSPGAVIVFNGQHQSTTQPSDLIELVVAATDDPDDLETP